MSILLGKGAFKIMTEGRTLSFDQRYYNMKTSLDIPVQKTYESITGHIWIEFFGYTNEYTITIVGLSKTAWEDYFVHLIGADILFQPFDDLAYEEKCDILELRPFYKDELLWKDAIQIKLASSELNKKTCWRERHYYEIKNIEATPSDVWNYGDRIDITYESNFTDNIDIYLTSEDGTNDELIHANVSNTGSYTFTFNQHIDGDNFHVKIYKNSNNEVFGVGTQVLSINRYNLTVAPFADNKVTEGMMNEIRWTSNYYYGSFYHVKIELERDGDTEVVVENTAEYTYNYEWQVPTWSAEDTGYASDELRLKFTIVESGKVFYSNYFGSFRIPRISNVSITPDSWEYNTSVTATWDSNFSDSVDIVIRNTDGEFIIAEGIENDGYYSFASTDFIDAVTNTLYIRRSADHNVKAKQLQTIEIHTRHFEAAYLSSDTPVEGNIERIQWTTNYPDTFKIELERDGNIELITSSCSKEFYDWKVPVWSDVDSGYANDALRLKFTDNTSGDIFYSDYFGSINLAIIENIRTDNLIWEYGEVISVTWDSNFSDNVWINLTSNGEDHLIDANVSNTGSYTFTFNQHIDGDNFHVKIYKSSNDEVFGVGTQVLSIDGYNLTVTPFTDNKVTEGMMNKIRWTSNYYYGSFYHVKIELERDGNTEVIVENTAEYTYNYEWEVPTWSAEDTGYASDELRLKFTIIESGKVFYSDYFGSFNIADEPVIENITADSSDWQYGTDVILNWTTNFIGKVDIILTNASHERAIVEDVENTGSYTFTFKSYYPGEYSIKIRSHGGSTEGTSATTVNVSGDYLVIKDFGNKSVIENQGVAVEIDTNLTGNSSVYCLAGDNGSVITVKGDHELGTVCWWEVPAWHTGGTGEGYDINNPLERRQLKLTHNGNNYFGTYFGTSSSVL